MPLNLNKIESILFQFMSYVLVYSFNIADFRYTVVLPVIYVRMKYLKTPYFQFSRFNSLDVGVNEVSAGRNMVYLKFHNNRYRILKFK